MTGRPHKMQALGRTVETVVLSLMWLLLPAAPIAAYAISGHGSYLRNYRRTWRQCASQLRAMARAQVIARRFYNEKRASQQSQSWRIEGECSHCGQCCLDQTCVFLDRDERGHSKCSIYGNAFFGLLACAEYPMTKDDIELYNCPSFRAEPVDRPAQIRLGRHSIPVVVRQATVDNAIDGGVSSRS